MKASIQALTCAVATAALAALAPALPAAAAGPARAARHPVIISGIYYNSPGSDRGGNASLNHEWVRLHNTTGHAISLTGWTLRDAAHHVYRFGTYRLRAHGSVKIHTGHGRNTQRNRYWRHSWYIWNNTGDRATLKTAGGTVRARCRYSDPNEDRAFTGCR
jgi:hypothetical protein